MDQLNANEKKAAVRRAIMRINPEYFSWSMEDQERYRVTMSDADRFHIDQVLLKALFNIEAKTKEEIESVFNAFNDGQYLLFNSTILPLTGIGDDLFFLNEYLVDKTLLDFNTIYDYDYDDYLFQEEARKKETKDHIGQPYCGTLYYRWARLNIDGVFHYATLSCLAGYLLGKIDDAGSEMIDKLIPHEYVNGPNHGKREGRGFLYDKRIDAAGLEAQLEELRDRFYSYTSERYRALADIFDRKAQRRVYMLDRSNAHEPQMDFIFSDKEALQAVRFRHFMEDCRSIQGENRDVDIFIEEECKAVTGFLERMHQDILRNFDPRVKKFHRKRKIVMAEGALKDLF